MFVAARISTILYTKRNHSGESLGCRRYLFTTERMFRYVYGSYDAIFGATSAIRAAAAVVLTIELSIIPSSVVL